MSNKIDWSKAPEGATHYTPKGTGVYAAFWRKHCGEWKDAWVIEGQDGSVVHYKGPSSPSFESLAVERTTTPSWSGEGLPPVGADIEVLHELYGWIGARVVGQDGEAAIVRTNDGYAGVFPHQMRPIRTPEQIAAEEREAAILGIYQTICISRAQAEAIYDAGYRKP